MGTLFRIQVLRHQIHLGQRRWKASLILGQTLLVYHPQIRQHLILHWILYLLRQMHLHHPLIRFQTQLVERLIQALRRERRLPLIQ